MRSLNRVVIQFRGWAESLGLQKRSEHFRRSLRNALFNVGEGIITPALWVISAPIFVRKLGTDHFGIWMLVNGVIGAGGILSMGLTDATTKFVSKYRALNDMANVRRVTQATLLLYIVLGGVATLIVLGIAPWLATHGFKLVESDRPLALAALRIGGFGILARFIDNVFFSVFQGFERFDLNARVVVAVNTITTALNIFLVLTGYGLVPVLSAVVVMILVGSIAKAIVIRRYIDPEIRFIPRCSRESLHELLGFGVYSWVRQVMTLVVGYADRFLLGAYAGMTQVSYYTVCLQVMTQINGLLNRAGAFLFPLSSVLFEQGDRTRLRTIYNKSQFVFITLSCVLILPIYVTSGAFLRHWMGAEFAQQAALLLSLLCIRYVFTPEGIVNTGYLLGLGLVRLQALLVALSGAASLAGMIVLIPKYGALGAVLAQFLNFPIMLVNRYVIDRRLFRQSTLPQVFAFYVPVLVCLGIATLYVYHVDSFGYSLLGCAVAFVASAVFSGVLALATIRVCQRISLFPQ